MNAISSSPDSDVCNDAGRAGPAATSRRLPQLVAHRGNAREFPENTIASLRSAIDLGLRHIEFDIQLSADEVPVVIHDDTLVRTAGRPESVFELDAADLLKIEASERSRFDDRFSDIRIPSLEQVTELLAAHPQVTAFVEIKRASLQRFGGATVVSRVMEKLRPVRQQCVIVSFDLATMQSARQAGSAAVGWVLDQYDDRARGKYEALRPDYLFCNHLKLPRTTARLWRGPWRWVVYDIETVADAMALGNRGVEFVETMAVRSLLHGLRAISHG
jgi:glycerophosphoryl diester phosphodiesterase